MKEIKEGCNIFFKKEKLPMTLIAKTDRFGIATRYLDIESDYEIIWHEVERGKYQDIQEAYDALKNEIIYTYIDFEKEIKGDSDRLFCLYDYESKQSCIEAVNDMENGKHSISKRNFVELDIIRVEN
jgi:hypothetical protein